MRAGTTEPESQSTLLPSKLQNASERVNDFDTAGVGN